MLSPVLGFAFQGGAHRPYCIAGVDLEDKADVLPEPPQHRDLCEDRWRRPQDFPVGSLGSSSVGCQSRGDDC